MAHRRATLGQDRRATVMEPQGGRMPDDERTVADAETLKALSDPLRLRMLETMVARVDEPWTAKELAVRLAVPQTRLYHHLDLLLERDLIRVAEQQLVSGILETRYRVAALSFRLDRKLLAGDSALEAGGLELLHTVFDSTRDDIARALRRQVASGDGKASDPVDPAAPARNDLSIVRRGLARLSPTQAAEFHGRLTALIDEYASNDDIAKGHEAPSAPWGLLVAFYRLEAGEGHESGE